MAAAAGRATRCTPTPLDKALTQVAGAELKNVLRPFTKTDYPATLQTVLSESSYSVMIHLCYTLTIQPCIGVEGGETLVKSLAHMNFPS